MAVAFNLLFSPPPPHSPPPFPSAGDYEVKLDLAEFPPTEKI